MTITVYRSTDASAPVMSGSTGAMVALLDACLVNGYGAKPAAGWAKEFTGTNKGVYRAPSGVRFRLRVDDAGTTTCRVIGYETMSDVDTGAKAYPVEAQVSGGLYWIKSDTASATARPWILIASGRHFLLLINANASTTLPLSSHYCFGDFVPMRQNDSYCSILIGSIGTTHATTNSRGFGATNYLYGSILGHYIARASNGIAGSTAAGKHCAYLMISNTPTGPFAMGGGASSDFPGNGILMNAPTYPIANVGGIIIEPVYITDVAGFRGILPGLWNIGHYNATNLVGTHGDQIAGSGHHLIGKTFEIWKWTCTSIQSGAVVIEVSDTWPI